MCVVSMVYDYYKDKFDFPEVGTPDITTVPITVAGGTVQGITLTTPEYVVISKEEVEAIRSLIHEFRNAVSAAKTVDKLTNQPDCEDPQKKKLEDRVAMLEQQLAAMKAALLNNGEK